MENIVTAVQRVKDLISEIAAASMEQSSGIEQVSAAITQMDQVVQQNSSLVEEAAAATTSMKDQAMGLMEVVERFRLAPEDGAAAAPAAPAIAPIRFRPPAPAPRREPQRAPAARHGADAGGAWKEF